MLLPELLPELEAGPLSMLLVLMALTMTLGRR
jgi:hypothetical protein